jgi:DtxR family Mn-dependent transcriptional regulator
VVRPADSPPIPRSSRAGVGKAGEYHPAFEEYCEAIYELHEDSLDVIQARIAERLDVSRPAVSEMMRRMAGEGLILIGSTIQLTEAGQELAEAVVRRHRLAERLLTDVLGLPWSTAHNEAGKWEHVISPEVEAALARVLGEPTTCPHGNPIPGSDYTAPDSIPLRALVVGDEFTVVRITEDLEFAEGMLDFLEHHALIPGAVGRLASVGPDGSIIVEIDGHSVALGQFTRDRLLVTR